MRQSIGTCLPAAAKSSRCVGLPAMAGQGDRVLLLLGRVPELYVAALGTLKSGAVVSPLFSAFGPEPIRARMTIGEAKALVTSEVFYRRKIEPWRKELPGLQHVS
jgi:acetyl-CoA synthetase